MDWHPEDPVAESLWADAIAAGMIASPGLLRIPVTAFTKPGIFAAARLWRAGLFCPRCGGSAIIRFGLRKHGVGLIQQFQCKANCGAGGSGYRFTEYSGTALENSRVTAEQWLAIWYWRHSTPEPLRKLKAIGKDLGLVPTTVQQIAAHEQSTICRRRNTSPSRKDWLDFVWRRLGHRGPRPPRGVTGRDEELFRRENPGIGPARRSLHFKRHRPTGRLFTNDARYVSAEILVVQGDPVGTGPTADLWAEIRPM